MTRTWDEKVYSQQISSSGSSGVQVEMESQESQKEAELGPSSLTGLIKKPVINSLI